MYSITLLEHSSGIGQVLFRDNTTGNGILYFLEGFTNVFFVINSPSVMEQLGEVRGKTFKLLGKIYYRTLLEGESLGKEGGFIGCKIQTRDTRGKWEKAMVIGEIPKK